MSELRKGVGAGAFVLLPIACCVGLPLLVAAGIGAVALAWGAGVVAALRERGSEQREEVVQR